MWIGFPDSLLTGVHWSHKVGQIFAAKEQLFAARGQIFDAKGQTFAAEGQAEQSTGPFSTWLKPILVWVSMMEKKNLSCLKYCEKFQNPVEEQICMLVKITPTI